jgi:carbon storage regulator CsrA
MKRDSVGVVSSKRVKGSLVGPTPQSRSNNFAWRMKTMLVLSVLPNGIVYVGDNIEVVNVGDRRIKIGIDAPPEVKILRKEVRDRELRDEE